MKNPRIIAVQILRAVLQNGESLNRAELKYLSLTLTVQDRSLVRALCFGVLRWYSRLQAILSLLLERPLKGKDDDVRLLLLIGLYQLIEQRVPDYAAVSETVNAVVQLKKQWAKGMVNAVLRNFSRQQEKLIEKVDQQEISRVAFPKWLLQLIQNDWPQHWQEIAVASNEPAPMSLRVNQQKTSVEKYQALLKQNEIDAQTFVDFEDAIQLQQACDVVGLPMFNAGAVSVQDCAAQLAARLLAPSAGDRVLDACAAPGGKTGHILELQPALAKLFSIDSDSHRLERVQENLLRLGYDGQQTIQLVAADAGNIEAWWNGDLFDCILLDAPCSGTGVIRRHPDIKWLRRESDIAALVATQAQLLRQLWKVLKPGGVLLYATCSILKVENGLQLEQFCREVSDAQCESLNLPFGEQGEFGIQILPGKLSSDANLDGFYYARLKKQA